MNGAHNLNVEQKKLDTKRVQKRVQTVQFPSQTLNRQYSSMVSEDRIAVTFRSRVISGEGGTREPYGILGNGQYLIWSSSSWEVYVKMHQAEY